MNHKPFEIYILEKRSFFYPFLKFFDFKSRSTSSRDWDYSSILSAAAGFFFVLQNPSSYNPIDFDRNMHARDIDVERERVETDKKLTGSKERLSISP